MEGSSGNEARRSLEAGSLGETRRTGGLVRPEDHEAWQGQETRRNLFKEASQGRLGT